MNKVEKLSTVPSAFSAIAEKVNEVIDAHLPLKAGRFIKITTSNENVLISCNITDQELGLSSSATFYHPFKVVLTNPGTPSVNIIAESRLYSALSPAATLTIGNLTTTITLTSTTKIWLRGTVSSSLVTSVPIITTTDPANLITYSGATQTQWHVLIGKVSSGANADAPGFDFQISGADYHFEQTLFNHLLIEYRCNTGYPSVYPFAFTGT